MNIYGQEFAAVYNDKWAFWAPKMWPFLSRLIAKDMPYAETWLDLCCGTGSLLHLVCKHGFRATGVDMSKHQIEHARRNAAGAKLLIQDIRTLSLPQKFDIVTSMFDSLNYLTKTQDLFKVIQKVNRHLSRGGLFIFDMNTFEGLEDHWCNIRTCHERKLTLITEASFDSKKAIGRFFITGFVCRSGIYHKFQEEHFERGYRAKEIEDILSQVGLSFTKYDGNTLGRVKKRSGRLLYVCKAK
jgi:SAM-dependent methyltransferase